MRVQKFDEIRQQLEPKLIAESLKINSEVYSATIQYIQMTRPYGYKVLIDSLGYSPSDIPEKAKEIVTLISESYTLLLKGVDKLDINVSQELHEFEKEMFN